jgi:mono/diheme cytochrome c family protein
MRATPLLALLLGTLGSLGLGACRQDMHDQPKLETFEGSTFFPDGRASRPLVPGTVARGRLFEDEHLYRGTVDGVPAETIPFELTEEVLDRGRERYSIFCAPCHGAAGTGDGMIVQRGMTRPTSFHLERLREAPPGYFFDVITRGFGAMYDYSDRIEPEDRWAVIGYVRALQLSQNATLADVPPEQREQLEAAR